MHGDASIDLDQEANIKNCMNPMKTRSASRGQWNMNARYPRRYKLLNLTLLLV